MWPKVLFELLPHFARLMPIADKYLSKRNLSDKSQEAALTAMAADMRGELGKVTEANDGISRQLCEQSAQIAEIAVEVTRTRLGIESVEARMAKLETALLTATRLLAAALMLVFLTYVILLVRKA